MEDDDLEGLSEQERAALQGESEDEATLKAIAEKEAPDDADKGADKDEADDEKDDGPEAKGAADKDEGEEAGEKAEKDDKGEPAAEPAKAAAAEPEKKEPPARADEPAAYTIAAPEDAAEQIKALHTAKAAEFKKLMDGDITPEEYSAKEGEILGQISAIERQVTAATVATEITMQNAQRSYLGKVNALLDKAKKDEGIDYRAPENEALHGELDRTVKWLASDPANADKPEQWFLDEAHAMVKARHGLGKAQEQRPDPAKKETKGGRAPDLSGLPPSLRNVPAAAESDDGGEFAHLNGLKGMQLERALAKMSPEEQQRYLEN